MSSREFERQRAEELAAQLESHYESYIQPPEKSAGQRDLGKLFRGWFSSNEHQAEPIHQQFLAGTESLSRELARMLAGLDPEVSRPLALREARLILEHSVSCSDLDRTAYLTAAEVQCIPLLPYLTREELASLRDSMLSRTPKRMMFPKQLEVLQAMERLMGEHDKS